MSSQIKVDMKMVELAKWVDVTTSTEFQTTILKHIDKRVITLRQNKASVREKVSGVDLAVDILRLEDRIDELELLKKTFERKAREYERGLKGELHG